MWPSDSAVRSIILKSLFNLKLKLSALANLIAFRSAPAEGQSTSSRIAIIPPNFPKRLSPWTRENTYCKRCKTIEPEINIFQSTWYSSFSKFAKFSRESSRAAHSTYPLISAAALERRVKVVLKTHSNYSNLLLVESSEEKRELRLSSKDSTSENCCMINTWSPFAVQRELCRLLCCRPRSISLCKYQYYGCCCCFE